MWAALSLGFGPCTKDIKIAWIFPADESCKVRHYLEIPVADTLSLPREVLPPIHLADTQKDFTHLGLLVRQPRERGGGEYTPSPSDKCVDSLTLCREPWLDAEY